MMMEDTVADNDVKIALIMDTGGAASSAEEAARALDESGGDVDRVVGEPSVAIASNENESTDQVMPPHYVPETVPIDLETAVNSDAMPASNVPDSIAPVAAHLVGTDEVEQRMLELEEQNRMLQERERKLIGIGFIILLVAAGIFLGIVLTRDSCDEPEHTLPPTPEPTTELLGDLSEFLAERASFDGGAAIVDQSTPQYQAAKWLSNNTNLFAYGDKQKIQRYVLATLYYSTNGDYWTTNTSWLDDEDECGRWWQYENDTLSCTSKGEVNRLFLDENNLKGEIPPELALLSDSLEMIGFWMNEMTGTVPTELAHLFLLKSLDVDGNALTGPVMTELGLMTKLDYLGMEYNEFTGPIPTELFLLTNLLTLKVGSNLNGTIPSDISLLTSLSNLGFHDNANLTGTIPSEIGLLSSLTDLSLWSNQLSGTIPSTLGVLSSLELLYLDSNRLTGTIPTNIGLLPKLQFLWVEFNSLTGTIPTSIGLLTSLEEFWFNDNSFSGSIPNLSALSSVKQLLIGDNKLTGNIPTEIGLLSTLTVLFLQKNALTGPIPAEIGLLSNLVHISLKENDLTGTIPSSIHDMPSLQTLWLENNNFTGPFTCPMDVPDCKISCEFDNETCRVLP